MHHCAHLLYLTFSVEFDIFDILSNNIAKTKVNNISKMKKKKAHMNQIWLNFGLRILVSMVVLTVNLTHSRIT